jgi:hypothetical protein
MGGELMRLIAYSAQDVYLTSYTFMEYYLNLIDADWKNISIIPVGEQNIPILMRCVKTMLNIPDETEYRTFLHK